MTFGTSVRPRSVLIDGLIDRIREFPWDLPPSSLSEDTVRLPIALVVLLIAAGVAASGQVVANEHFDVTAHPNIDTPPRTVTYQGMSFQVDHLGHVEPGEPVNVEVDAEAEEAYSVALYDADGFRLAEDDGVGSDAFTFETSSTDGTTYTPGTYVVAVNDNGFQAIAPLVITGYRLSVDAPSTVESGSMVRVDASVTTIDDAKSIDRVQVVIGDENHHERVTLSSDGDSDYTKTFALDSFPEGDYDLYVVAQGSEEVLGQQEVLGVSASQSFRVGQESTSDDSSEDSSGGGSSGSDGSDEEETPESQPTSTVDETTTSDTKGTSDVNTDDANTDDDTPTTSDESVITPNTQATEPSTTDSPGQPLGVFPVLLTLLLVTIIARRR